MADYKTQGVYVEEISTLPPSVAGVATAVPAFIGYTEKHQETVRALIILQHTLLLCWNIIKCLVEHLALVV